MIANRLVRFDAEHSGPSRNKARIDVAPTILPGRFHMAEHFFAGVTATGSSKPSLSMWCIAARHIRRS